jgi:hypothetical protein
MLTLIAGLIAPMSASANGTPEQHKADVELHVMLEKIGQKGGLHGLSVPELDPSGVSGALALAAGGALALFGRRRRVA